MQNSLKKENYQLLIAQAKLLFKKEKNWLANLSNASAMLNITLPNSVFTGFYVFNNQELILGPYYMCSIYLCHFISPSGNWGQGYQRNHECHCLPF